ncbi:MAG TPA: ribonucleoside hydrolase RihC [Candidatus Avamphibacillus sp.]|nr:ribonucleoside hydrolase RihC [Candidatus Avamphibacillus sp.]
MEKKPIIIDTDPGIDDAVALAIALHSEKLDVRQITTVHGNVSLDKTTVNALKLLEFFNKEVAVSAGATRPLLRESINASQVHGESGLDGFTFPEPDQHLLTKEHAVNVMHREIMESKEKITLVPIGPLTNIALLIRTFPEVCHHIEEIVLMGGSAGRGNASPMAEFNILADPEAAKIVFGSEIPIVMLGLDIGKRARIFPEDSLRIKEMNETGNMVYHLLTHYRGDVIDSGLSMYDCTAIGYLLEPEMYQTVDTFVDIETNGTLTAGCTVVDLNDHLEKRPNAKVALDLDEQAFKKWLLKSLENCR